MVRTDVFRRGAPWAALLLRYRTAPADLNLNWRARIATIAAALLAATILLLLILGQTAALLPIMVFFLAAWVCAGLATDSAEHERRHHWKSPLALTVAIVPPVGAYALFPDHWVWLPLMLVAMIVWMQRGFYRLLWARGGAGLAIAAVPLQVLFFLCCALSVPLGWLIFMRQRSAGGRDDSAFGAS